MRGVSVQVRLERFLGALVQVVVVGDELLELGLYVDDLLGGELEFDDGDAGGFEVGEEADFVGLGMLVLEWSGVEGLTWRNRRLRPLVSFPRAVRPTRWM